MLDTLRVLFYPGFSFSCLWCLTLCGYQYFVTKSHQQFMFCFILRYFFNYNYSTVSYLIPYYVKLSHSLMLCNSVFARPFEIESATMWHFKFSLVLVNRYVMLLGFCT